MEFLLEKAIDINCAQDLDSQYNLLAKGQTDKSSLLLNQAAAQGNRDMFDRFVTLGIDPSSSMALHWVSYCQDPLKAGEMVAHLVERYNLDVNADDTCGGLRQLRGFASYPDPETPLEWAIMQNNIPAAQVLIKLGADPNNSTHSHA